jgi:DNA-3-methyladenine glycosylase
VLIRALRPTIGLEAMRRRRDVAREEDLCSGPGKLTEALGVGLRDNGADLGAPPFALLSRQGEWEEVEVTVGPRIGITKATENPWRFCAADCRFVSRPWPVQRAA